MENYEEVLTETVEYVKELDDIQKKMKKMIEDNRQYKKEVQDMKKNLDFVKYEKTVETYEKLYSKIMKIKKGK
jgi:regulator of replication initiation timing